MLIVLKVILVTEDADFKQSEALLKIAIGGRGHPQRINQ